MTLRNQILEFINLNCSFLNLKTEHQIAAWKIGFGKSRNFKSDSDENFTGNKKNFFNKKKSNFNPAFKSRDRNFKGFASDRSPDSNEGFSQENKSINYAKKRPFAKNFSSKNSKFTTKKPFKSNNFRKNKY